MSTADGISIQSRVMDEASNVMHISISGYIDQANCHELQEAIDRCLEQNSYNLVFDLQNLVYMSSAGWGVLIGEIKRFRENGGDIKLCNMGPEIYEIYQMLEFYHIISEYPTAEEALKAFVAEDGTERLDSPAPNQSPQSKKADDQASESSGAEISSESEEPAAVQIDPVSTESATSQAETAETVSADQEAAPEATSVVIEEEVSVNFDEIFTEVEADGVSIVHERPSDYVEFDPAKYNRKLDAKMMPVPDKIRSIVARHPEFTPSQIRKMLRHDDYGNVKVGRFKMRSLLKQLELDTKEKRFRYFRSA